MSKVSRPELSPCPFCGSKDTIATPTDYTYTDNDTGKEIQPYIVFCKKCRTQGPEAKTPTQAIELWQLRR